MSSFQIVGLSREPFETLFVLSSEELARRGVLRVKATAKPGFPCRISLVDAEVDDELLLLPFEHQPENSPYRSSGPIYVGATAVQRTLEVGEIPEYVSLRQISLRAYDGAHTIVAAEVCAGAQVAVEIERQFAIRSSATSICTMPSAAAFHVWSGARQGWPMRPPGRSSTSQLKDGDDLALRP